MTKETRMTNLKTRKVRRKLPARSIVRHSGFCHSLVIRHWWGIRHFPTSPHRDDARHFRHAFAEVALDALVEGHAAAGAAVAGAVEADLDDAFGVHVDQLDVAAVGLDGGADQ